MTSKNDSGPSPENLMATTPEMKTGIKPETIRLLAQLAKLSLSDTEIGTYREDLSKIIGYMSLIDQVEIDDLPPASIKGGRLRDDEVIETENREQYLELCPDRSGDFIRVPLTIRKV